MLKSLSLITNSLTNPKMLSKLINSSSFNSNPNSASNSITSVVVSSNSIVPSFALTTSLVNWTSKLNAKCSYLTAPLNLTPNSGVKLTCPAKLTSSLSLTKSRLTSNCLLFVNWYIPLIRSSLTLISLNVINLPIGVSIIISSVWCVILIFKSSNKLMSSDLFWYVSLISFSFTLTTKLIESVTVKSLISKLSINDKSRVFVRALIASRFNPNSSASLKNLTASAISSTLIVKLIKSNACK